MSTIKYLIDEFTRSLNAYTTFIVIIVLNIMIRNLCSYLGCYQLTADNLLHLNMICNGCTNITYEFQKYQINIYFLIGKYILEMVDKYIKEVKKKLKVE